MSDAEPVICPTCNADMTKQLGCGGNQDGCPGMELFMHLHALECSFCDIGLPLTMGLHRRAKGGRTFECTANVKGYEGARR